MEGLLKIRKIVINVIILIFFINILNMSGQADSTVYASSQKNYQKFDKLSKSEKKKVYVIDETGRACEIKMDECPDFSKVGVNPSKCWNGDVVWMQ